MNKDKYYMNKALVQAKKAYKLKEVPIGAVIVCDDQIVGRGYNKRETDNDPTAHAEIIAIKKAAQTIEDWRLEDCSIYVTVEPCMMCAGAIQKARIKRLVYGALSEKDGACGTVFNLLDNNLLNHQVEIVSGVLAQKSKKLIKEFFEDLRSGRMGESG